MNEPIKTKKGKKVKTTLYRDVGVAKRECPYYQKNSAGMCALIQEICERADDVTDYTSCYIFQCADLFQKKEA